MTSTAACPREAAAELERLRAENARLLRLLKLTPEQAALPRPGQAGLFEAPPGPVHGGSSPTEKVAFFGALFAMQERSRFADLIEDAIDQLAVKGPPYGGGSLTGSRAAVITT